LKNSRTEESMAALRRRVFKLAPGCHLSMMKRLH
jgi:hypothetical protein